MDSSENKSPQKSDIKKILIAAAVVLVAIGGYYSGKWRDNNYVSNENTENEIIANTIVGDTVVPVDLGDTAKMDLMEKDSLRMMQAFQLAANRYAKAYLAKNAGICAEYAIPAMVKAYKGEENYKNKLQQYFQADPIQPERIVAGPIDRLGVKLDKEGYGYGWYCIMPVRRYLTQNGKKVVDIQYMAGQTLDEGKKIYFIDITGMPLGKIQMLMPDIDCIIKPNEVVGQ